MRIPPGRLLPALLVVSLLWLILDACKYDHGAPAVADGNFPPAVNRIFVTRCAVAGCHNAASSSGAAGIRLDSWEQLFNGGAHGAVLIPYDIENSSLLYFINTDHTLGHTQEPTMPLNATPLSREEFLTIRDWVASGAPDKNGNIPFASNADSRQKIYMTMQGCDLLAVIDAQRNVIMRYIKIGETNDIESPHCVRVDPAGRYAYVCFLGGTTVQKIDTRTDQLVGSVGIGQGNWNVVHLSEDGSKLVVSDFQNGQLKLINTASMVVTKVISSPTYFKNLHGIASNLAFDTFYVTAQYGNVVYKIAADGSWFKQVTIDGAPPNFNRGARDPHEIQMSPDHSKYFLTCEASGEIRVMDTYADTLIAVIDVPLKPQEMAVSLSRPYLLVTCIEAPNPLPFSKGAVVAINYNTLQTVSTMYGNFYQPHGISIDDREDRFYVVSVNADTAGAAPHHVSICNGRNGYYSVYQLGTLQPVNDTRYETSVFPYSADTRFK